MENWQLTGKREDHPRAVSYLVRTAGRVGLLQPITPPTSPPGVMEYKVNRVRGPSKARAWPYSSPRRLPCRQCRRPVQSEQHLWWEKGSRATSSCSIQRRCRRQERCHRPSDRNRTYGRVQLYVNDAKAGEPVDLFVERLAGDTGDQPRRLRSAEGAEPASRWKCSGSEREGREKHEVRHRLPAAERK